MSYQLALEAAGAQVHEFESFGSYQGDWVAKVTYNGETGWVWGYFGSCTGCDAFEAEFGWSAEEEPNYQQRLADFGRGYLDGLYSQEELEKQFTDRGWMGTEDEELLAFVRAHAS